MRNWAGNITFNAAKIERPKSVEEMQEIVRRSTKLRALGSGHSFNHLADTSGTLVTLADLPRTTYVNRGASTITVDAGATYASILPQLAEAGLGLATVASLPHITIAGATATATHGSGDKTQNLSAAVSALKIIRGDGELITLRQGDADFDGAVVHLGALGIVTEVTLDLIPAYEIAQSVYLNLPVERVVSDFDAITSSAYSVSMFTRWRGDHVDQLWHKAHTSAGVPAESLFGATAAPRAYHPIPELDGNACTPQMGVPGPWQDRMFHFPASSVPSAGAELQSEFFVDRKDAPAAFEALYRVQESIAPPLFVSEIRTMAADSLWLSMAYGRDSVGFHFTWKPEAEAVAKAIDVVEAALAPFEARPHWAKVYNMAPSLVARKYPRLAAFKALATRFDPEEKFRNDYVGRLLA